MGNEGISPKFEHKLEKTAERFIKRFDRNDDHLIQPKEQQAKHTRPDSSSQPVVAFSGENVFFMQAGTAKADVLDGKLFTSADTSGDKALSSKELVGDFLKKHDTNHDGTTTKAELKADDADSKRALRKELRAQTHEVTVDDTTSFFGRLGGK